MFNRKKKTAPGKNAPQANTKLKHSLLSLEQRLMFDAAAAATAAEVNQEQVAQEQAEAAVSSHAGGDGPTADQRESHDLLQAIATYHPGESTTEMAFVDPTVPNYQEMVAGIGSHVEVVVLDATRDGMDQIAESLAGRSNIDAIHLISHGSSGELQLGTGTLTAESMAGEYANEMATIRESLSGQADLLVYGCNFGEGSEGVEAVNLLAEITGADVAASSDRTGHIDLGGDWEFEVQVGSIETDLALTDATQMNWAGILGTETVRDEFSTRSYGNNDGTQRWASTWSETDADGGGAKGGDIRVKSGQLRIDTDAVGNAAGRSVDLSGATSATLTFTYRNTLSGADRIEVRASNDGGATYTTLAGGVFSDSSNTGTGSLSLDISEYASSNTRIQFIVSTAERGGGDRLYVDNVQVSYDTGAANNAPTIGSNGAGATASVGVAENSSTVTSVMATDSDAGQTLTYSIAGGADAAQFTINSSTGQLSFASAPNYEAPTDNGGNNVYDVTVQVSDGQGGMDTQAIAVTVANVNEGPTDLALSANSVAENATTGTVVGTISGTDPDAGDTKTYSLTDTAGGRFAIDPATGVLIVADGSLLNYEGATSHTVTVRVTDSGGQSYRETFTINLTNVNEGPTGADTTVTLSEDTSHTLSTANFGFSDVDAGDTMSAVRIETLPTAGTLTLSGVAVTAGQVVSVAELTAGNLVFTPAANASGAGYAAVTFSVRDSAGAYDTAPNTLTFTVTAVNDAPTDLSLSANSVAENAATGTVVGTVTGTDVDTGDTKTYSLTDTAGGRFAIDSATGQLTVADGSLLNYEAASTHSVIVRVTDSGRLTYDETFTINLTNVNETPTITSNGGGATASLNVAEQETTVTTVAAVDVDAGTPLTYSIAGGPDAARFAIDGVTGELRFSAAPNFERPSDVGRNNVYDVTVQVSDGQGGTATQSISVRVTDVNEAPRITSNRGGDVASVTIRENGSAVTTVRATDPDRGARITYSVVGGADAVLFTINPSTGVLRFSSAPNFEQPTDTDRNNVYQVVVQASDARGGTDSQVISVRVTNVNEAPTDLRLSANRVAEHAAAGTVIGTVTSRDPDTRDTKTYSLTDSADGRFAIHRSTGVMTVADGSLLDYESATSHSVTVRVTDRSGQSYEETLTINLTNVNDAPTGTNATITMTEDTAHTLTAANFGFSDVDAGDSLSAVRIDTLPSAGTLTLSGAAMTAGQVVSAADITAGNLVFSPAADANGTGYANVTFSVRDSANAYDPAPNTLTFTVTAVSDAPTGLPLITGTVTEGQTLAADTSGLADADGLGVFSYQWLRDGVAIAGATSSTYTLSDAAVGAQISVTVSYLDGQGTSESVTSVPTEAVTNVNDAPLLVTNTGSTVTEGSIDTIDANELVVTDVDNSAAQLTYTIGTGPAYGRLELTTAPGVSATTFTQADIAANRLVYVHNGSETASDSFTFTVGDGAGGALGTTTMTLTITPVNNAPTITSDGGAATASIDVAEHVSAITIVTGADVALPAQALTYSISGGVDQVRFTINTVTGSLKFAAPANFKAATDANGDNVYVVQVQVTDSQGANTIQTIHVTVTDVVENAPSPPPTIPPVLLPQPPVPPGPRTPPSAGSPTLDHGPVPGPSGPPVELHPISQEPLTLVLPPDRPVARVPEEPRKPTDDVKETPLFLVNDDPRRPLFTVLPVEPTATLEPEPPETKQTVSDLLMAKLDEMTVSLEQAMSVSREQREIVARVAAVTGITLSAGFVTWALRSGTLLASCLATMPAWRHFDPLPVVRLSRAERTRRREEMARASQQEATEFSGLKRVLDDKPPLKRTA